MQSSGKLPQGLHFCCLAYSSGPHWPLGRLPIKLLWPPQGAGDAGPAPAFPGTGSEYP